MNKEALQLWPKLFNASNARAVVTCERCCKPHVVLMAEGHVSLVPALRLLIDRVDYSCGVPLDIPEDHLLHNKVRSCACVCAVDTVFRVTGTTTTTTTTTTTAAVTTTTAATTPPPPTTTVLSVCYAGVHFHDLLWLAVCMYDDFSNKHNVTRLL